VHNTHVPQYGTGSSSAITGFAIWPGLTSISYGIGTRRSPTQANPEINSTIRFIVNNNYVVHTPPWIMFELDKPVGCLVRHTALPCRWQSSLGRWADKRGAVAALCYSPPPEAGLGNGGYKNSIKIET
jgi:hypothetical protein